MNRGPEPTAGAYRRFARAEARGASPCYEEWALGVATDREVLALLGALPAARRQPNLLFAAARYAGIPAGPYAEFRTALLARWTEVREVMLAKRTQTNEPGRCAVLLPLLAALPQPLALLEVGASAGLCLYPDRYSYRYGDGSRVDPATGQSPVVLDCAVSGPVPVPTAPPTVVWRAGIDLDPLDVNAHDDLRWLETLVWPEHEHRRTRLVAAIGIARAEPPHIVAGDLNERLAELAATAPSGATLVIFHSAVLAYVPPERRRAFTTTVRTLDARWIANEGPGALPVIAPPSPEPDRALFLLTLDGEPVAYSAGHGQSLHWLAP
jgi:hypothetical protein